jgi:carbonic anhydrase/acetyltransferase-like protein (isoleucine patch superfamily)
VRRLRAACTTSDFAAERVVTARREYGAAVASIDVSAWVAPTAVVTGEVSLGPGVRVLHGAVLNGDRGSLVLGEDVVVMENAVLRGRPEHPLVVGDAVLIGPHAHLNGARIEEEVFVATGVSVFAGAVAGARSELRVGSVLQVNSELPPDTVVPIGWIAVGRPAQLFSPDRHEELWAVQEGLDFPGTMYGVPRGTSMREIMRRQSAAYGPPE